MLWWFRFHLNLTLDCQTTFRVSVYRWLEFSQTVGLRYVWGRLSHFNDMGFSTDNLIPSQKVVRTVGNFTLVCRGWLPMRFIVEGKETQQALYICDKVDRIYFSKGACIDVGILSPVFPHPMSLLNQSFLSCIQPSLQLVQLSVLANCSPQWNFQSVGNASHTTLLRRMSPSWKNGCWMNLQPLHSITKVSSRSCQDQMAIFICEKMLSLGLVMPLSQCHFISRRL